MFILLLIVVLLCAYFNVKESTIIWIILAIVALY